MSLLASEDLATLQNGEIWSLEHTTVTSLPTTLTTAITPAPTSLDVSDNDYWSTITTVGEVWTMYLETVSDVPSTFSSVARSSTVPTPTPTSLTTSFTPTATALETIGDFDGFVTTFEGGPWTLRIVTRTPISSITITTQAPAPWDDDWSTTTSGGKVWVELISTIWAYPSTSSATATSTTSSATTSLNATAAIEGIVEALQGLTSSAALYTTATVPADDLGSTLASDKTSVLTTPTPTSFNINPSSGCLAPYANATASASQRPNVPSASSTFTTSSTLVPIYQGVSSTSGVTAGTRIVVMALLVASMLF